MGGRRNFSLAIVDRGSTILRLNEAEGLYDEPSQTVDDCG